MTAVPKKMVSGVADTDVVERGGEPSDSRFDEILDSPHYERLRARLIRIFARRGCSCAEDLADETIVRVVNRLVERALDFRGDPKRYFFGVARNVYLEYLREPAPRALDNDPPRPPEDPASATESSRHDCLERCLSRLDPRDRVLVTEYYQHEKGAQVDHRKQLASRMGIGLNALYIRVHRIRRQLGRCVTRCASSVRMR